MKEVLFFVIICIVGIVLWTETKRLLNIEPFQNKASSATPTLNVPKAGPPPATLYPGSPQPFAPPTTALLAPPPGQSASVNTYPYEDPALKKAAATRIQSVLISVKGFLLNEAPGLQKLGDPSVTLPLGVARADAQRLEDEIAVLARSPGIQSSLTEADLNQIEANLGYLQRKWRMSANSMPEVEGFQVPIAGTPTGTAATGSTTPLQYLQQWFGNPQANYFSNGVTAAGTSAKTSTGTGTMATLQDLKNLIVAVAQKIQSINNSGTQDELMLNRVANLENVKKTVQGIIDKIEITKTMTEAQINLPKSWYNDFMAGLASGGELPALPSSAATAGSTGGSNNLADMLGSVNPDILKNVSFDWDIKLRYTGETERTLTEEALKKAASAVPGAPTPTFTYGPGDETVEKGSYRGAFDSIINYLSGKGDADIVAGVTSNSSSEKGSTEKPVAKSGPPTKFDWKEKSAFICDQIEKRELDPYEFGCMKDTTVVSENFSYRGYAKMICSRLATNYDPSIPELCGCPPPVWPGWRA